MLVFSPLVPLFGFLLLLALLLVTPSAFMLLGALAITILVKRWRE